MVVGQFLPYSDRAGGESRHSVGHLKVVGELEDEVSQIVGVDVETRLDRGSPKLDQEVANGVTGPPTPLWNPEPDKPPVPIPRFKPGIDPMCEG